MSQIMKDQIQKTIKSYARIPKIKNGCRLVVVSLLLLIIGLFIMKEDTVAAANNKPYYIKVNKLMNCITIYEKDDQGKYTIPVKAMTCSTGSATPLGTYNTMIKYRWKLLMGDVWGQYSTRIVKGILFHSVWYYEKDPSTLSSNQYNKLGSDASHGCIRLTVADAKWIYDNCPVGTTVEIYNSKDPGPLGKPETLKLLWGTGWDPTDLDKNNPFLNKKPTIKGAKNLTVEWGEEKDLLKGVTATSTAGTDITSKLKVDGEVDFYTAGEYTIKYSVTDAIGRSRTKKVTVTVKDAELTAEIKGVRDRFVMESTIIDREFALEDVFAYIDDKELPMEDITVEIFEDSEDKYTIEYSLTSQSNIVTTATATVIVDHNAPVIEGLKHRELTLAQFNSGRDGIKKIALEGITVSDDFTKLSKDQIYLYAVIKSDYAYLVTYEIFDEAGNRTRETVQFTYFKDARIDGVSNHNKIPAGTVINLDYVKQGVTSSLGDMDTTSQMQIEIIENSKREYIITYSTSTMDGDLINVVAYYTVSE